MHLALIKTFGNQNYIVATNKLRENVGASQLTYLCGTNFVIDAVEHVRGRNSRAAQHTMTEVREYLLGKATNLRISDAPDDPHPVEIVVATSGKALLLVKDRETGRQEPRHNNGMHLTALSLSFINLAPCYVGCVVSSGGG